jgi:hypothetical protein
MTISQTQDVTEMSEAQHTSGNGQQVAGQVEPVDPMDAIIAALADEEAPPVQNQEMIFSFKKPRKVEDPKSPGKMIDATDELGQVIQARTPLKLQVPIPTMPGLLRAMTDPKKRELILDIVGDAVREAVRQQVNDESTPVMKQEDLKVEFLSLDYLANLPKSERTGRGISKETWQEWVQDYVATIMEVSGSTAEKVGNQARLLYPGRLQPVKMQKKVLGFLSDQLNKWSANSPNAETYDDIKVFLQKKADEFLNLTEDDYVNNLQ